MKKILVIIAIFLVWRFLLFLPIVAGHTMLTYHKGYEYTKIAFYNYNPKSIVNNYLLSPWANFDGVAYLAIAGNGYGKANARFFPAYPIIVHGVTMLFGGGKSFGLKQFLIALIISNIFFLAAIIVFYELIRLDFSASTAISSIVFLLIFPTSFFYASIYTESSFLLFSLLSFFFARKKQWILAGVFGFLLCATRIVGLAIIPVLLYEFWLSEKSELKEKLKKSIPIFFAPFGLVAFMVYNWTQWKNPFYFLIAQGQVHNGRSVSSIVLFPQTIFRYIKIFITVTHGSFEWWISLLELSTFLFVCVLFYIAWKKKIRMSYILFGLLCFLPPISSGTFTGIPRYVIIFFPLFITLALMRKNFFIILYIAISIILLFLCTLYFSQGYFVA